MEQATSFEQQWKKNQRKKTTRTVVIVLIVLAVALTAAYGYISRNAVTAADGDSTLSYQVERMHAGTVQTTITASGALEPAALFEQSAQLAGEIVAVNCAVGDTVRKGDLLVQLENSSYTADRDEILSSLDSVNRSLEAASETVSSKKLVAGLAGRVKDIQIKPGDSLDDVMERVGYLMLISSGGSMQVTIETRLLKKNDKVDVKAGGESIPGFVASVDKEKNTVTVVIERDDLAVGTEAVVVAGDIALGAAQLTLREYIRMTGTDGFVASVEVKENQKVSRTATVALRQENMKASRYANLEQQRDDLNAQLRALNGQYVILAEEHGTVVEMPVAVGDEVEEGDSLVSVRADSGYTVSLSVDELDISAVSLGQAATVTLDAVAGVFEGEVTAISHKGDTSSGVARYTVEVSLPDIPGALQGMDASCVIVTADSGPGLIARAGAVQFDRESGQQFVWLAPADSMFGQSFDGDVNALQRVFVETGMSDGLFLIVNGDGLADGMLLVAPVLTTNASYNPYSAMRQNFQMMPGGGQATYIARGDGNVTVIGGGPGGNRGAGGNNSGGNRGAGGNNSGGGRQP